MSGRDVKTHPGKLLSGNAFNQTNASSHTSSLSCTDASFSLATGRKDEDVTISRSLEVSSGSTPDGVKDDGGSDWSNGRSSDWSSFVSPLSQKTSQGFASRFDCINTKHQLSTSTAFLKYCYLLRTSNAGGTCVVTDCNILKTFATILLDKCSVCLCTQFRSS